MPLMLFCPCGHSTVLPETSGSFSCSQCQRKHTLNWFSGPDALGKFREHRKRSERPVPVDADRYHVEFVPAAKAESRA